jgi:peptide-N4-(N-acetyl-beta-glucosaminyl)asparagine amidase
MELSYEASVPPVTGIVDNTSIRRFRCSEWAMLFGAILSSLEIKARIVHDFLDHCWNEAIIVPNGKWVHLDSTLPYPISLNHPYYYEENWERNTNMCWPLRQIK